MEQAIEAGIKNLAEKLNSNVDSNEALKFSQAALNLAHARAVLKQNK